MKIKIKIKRTEKSVVLPFVSKNGDWIDLRAARNVTVGLQQPVTRIPLGVAMELPKGFEAIVVARSSTPNNFGIWCPIAFGVIDNSYNGDKDEWSFPCTTIGQDVAQILKGDRICQFRIQLSQHATLWQKLKWLLSSGVKIVEVEELGNNNRGGFGTSGTR